jgi:hypothetical protein
LSQDHSLATFGHTSVKTTEIFLAFLTPEEARAVKYAGPQTGE